MRFFGQLTEKPWLTAQGRIDDLHEGAAFSLPRAELALRVFLAVVTVLFMLLIIAYAERMVHERLASCSAAAAFVAEHCDAGFEQRGVAMGKDCGRPRRELASATTARNGARPSGG